MGVFSPQSYALVSTAKSWSARWAATIAPSVRMGPPPLQAGG